jgi:hypothetical protein
MGNTCRSNDTSLKAENELYYFANVPTKPRPVFRERDQKYFYEVTFPSQPLFLTMTSSKTKVDGYVTDWSEKCPVKDDLVKNSKVIYVNEVLVEGCLVSTIAKHVVFGAIPLTITLARPEGLMPSEVPDKEAQSKIRQVS